MVSSSRYLAAFICVFIVLSQAIVLNLEDNASILSAAATTAFGLQQLYNGNTSTGVLGKFPYPPYYWWESGGAWSGMVEYWHYTGDSSYVDVTHQALVSQLGPANDWIVPSESFDEGNDDQSFWVFGAMSAAEHGFPPPTPPLPEWLTTVQNAWELFVRRWDTATCGGGLKWQFYPANAGFTYKNSISNGAFFQLSARLARYTGNQTYVDWAEKVWDWSTAVGLIDQLYNIFDGSDTLLNCSEIDHHQWTYNVGVYMYGAAILSNYTDASSVWVERTNGLLAATSTFLTPYKNASNILFEAACELDYSCNYDQLSMKAYLARWLAGTSQMAPWLAGRIGEILRSSAMGAAAACTGGPDRNTCGIRWYTGGFDTHTGVGQQLTATEVMYALLVNQTVPPLTLPNVVIGSFSASATATSPSAPAAPSSAETARPLYDKPGGGAGRSLLVSTCLLGLLVVSAIIYLTDH